MPGSAASSATVPAGCLPLPSSLVQLGAAALGDAHLGAVVLDRHADPRGLAALRVDELHVAEVDARLLLDEAAARVLLRGLAGLLDDVDVLDEDAALLAEHR